MHDIIDNRNEKLVDHINCVLDSSESAKFAVGYFFISGFVPIAKKLSKIKELRLLIGNMSNRETIEQIAEGRKRLELVSDEIEKQSYPKRTEKENMRDATTENMRQSMELMDQTDDSEGLIKVLISLIEEKRLKVKIYTKGRLHAKAYIFDYGEVYDSSGRPVTRTENGIAIVGSSNLSLAGITHNTELNVLVQGNGNHAELVRWFEELWKESDDFDETLMQELSKSWAAVQATPYDVYMKTLYTLVKDRIDEGDDTEILWHDEITSKLADFQKVAVRHAKGVINEYGGVFISDVVGMGKSLIGAAIITHFSRIKRVRPLIICPAALIDMWDAYNEKYQLNARVLSMGFLREGEGDEFNVLLNDERYRDRDFVLVDESHNFRNSNTQRYRLLQSFLAVGKLCCFLTATPRNKTAWDIYNQLKLFHQDDKTYFPINPPDLREYFKLIDKRERRLQDLLVNILIRRTRNHILRWYGYDSETDERVDPAQFRDYLEGKRRAYVLVGGKHQYFPKRELSTIQYSIEETYQGLYQELRAYIGKPRKERIAKPIYQELTFARYGLWHFVKKEKRKERPYTTLHKAGTNLRGLIRILLFKRLESSIYAFRVTIGRLLKIHERMLSALDSGIVPAGEDAQTILYESDYDDQTDLIDELKSVTGEYKSEDFEVDKLKEYIKHDIQVLKDIYKYVDNVGPDKDAKLQTLLGIMREKPLNSGKILIFTQYADTARYLYENLNPSESRNDIDVIFSNDKSKARMASRFAPKANPEFIFGPNDVEIMRLISTDVLSEGLNLQDCDKIINYDLHWNPVRLIQRFGRIDRIGSEHDVVYGFNFLPEIGIERNLGLHQILRNRIQEIHDTIGEDSAILDQSEELNEEAMYAIYEKKEGQIDLFDAEDDIVDVNEAAEFFKQMQKDNPEEYERIINMRDGIRSARPSASKGTFALCQAGNYQQTYMMDDKDNIERVDISNILDLIRCEKNSKVNQIPSDYNKRIMKVKKIFEEEVKQRLSEQQYSLNLTTGQKYVLRELRSYFNTVKDADWKSQINILEQAFRSELNQAIKRELNLLKRNDVIGKDLFTNLVRIYNQYDLKDVLDNKSAKTKNEQIPKIICSEALE